MSPVWPDIAAQISTVTGFLFRPERITPVSGGCINQAYRIEDALRRFFVKLNRPDTLFMFAAEQAGLEEIRRTGTLQVPTPVCCGSNAAHAWLVMEYLPVKSSGTKQGAILLGKGLAAMHDVTADRFGWVRHNTIGTTLQVNDFSADWVGFWREHRLGYQLQLARDNGYDGKLQSLGAQLAERIGVFFTGRHIVPSLLHGDFWSGNYGFDLAGRPVVFDPAVYYGDREADIAMTELFGGFPEYFYAAYREASPLDIGYAIRKNLYNLYHILNHLNLFGGSYLDQAEKMIARLLAEIR